MTISIVSLFISITAVVVTFYYNRLNHKEYIESIKPQLSFSLIEREGIIILSVVNNGFTEARDINLEIKSISNNGDRGLCVDQGLTYPFDLFPKEKVSGRVALSGKNISADIFPVVLLEVKYIEANGLKRVSLTRKISFDGLECTRNNTQGIEKEVRSIAFSNNRLANYIEGRTLFKSDEINACSSGSLVKDFWKEYESKKNK